MRTPCLPPGPDDAPGDGRAPGRVRAAGSGDIVVFFKAKDLQGQPVSLGELVARRRVAVLFWDWRRATSSRAMQALDRLQNLYRKQGLEVVAVEGEGSPVEQVLERVEKLRAIGIAQRYTIVPDPGGRIARQFRVESTPQIFLLDGAGRVFFHLEGFRADDEPVLEERVKAGLGIAAPRAPRRRRPPRRSRALTSPRHPNRPAESRPPRTRRSLFSRSTGTSAITTSIARSRQRRRSISARSSSWRRMTPSAWLHIGEACARQRRYDQAREAWEQVLRIEPGNREADANIRRLIRGEY